MASGAVGVNRVRTRLADPAVRRVAITQAIIYFILIVGAAVSILPFLYTVSVSLMNLTEATGGACAAYHAAVEQLR